MEKNSSFSNNIPTVLVVFGATGDLMAKKITPALFHLFRRGQLPSMFKVVGFARRDFSDEAFRERLTEILKKHTDSEMEKLVDNFLSLFAYEKGDFQSAEDYQALAKHLHLIDEEWGVCSNKLFYLAVPPELYQTIFNNLSGSGLTMPCSPEEGWTRVIVEKPFGKDLKTARELDELLGKLFREVQIYRIDHYLAKEMLQNILSFRFSNNPFETNWGNQLIESIHIRLLEKIGVEDRGAFYEGVGALRDVGQNHLLQMLALVTMDPPLKMTSEAIRNSRAAILSLLRVPSLEEIKTTSFRAQYEGYKDVQGVASNSSTETYFKMRAFLDSPRWRGVPIVMESGKRLEHQVKDIEIVFRHPTPCLCPSRDRHYKNRLIIHLEPYEGITILFWAKKPGLTMDIEERTFEFRFREQGKRTQYTEEYEKLLLDCISGDQTLFVNSEEIREMWRFIDPIFSAWQEGAVPLHTYTPDTETVLDVARSVGTSPHPVHIKEKQIAFVGLGKMGGNLARRLLEKGWKVAGYNKEEETTRVMEREGLIGTYSLEELANTFSSPRIFWLMIPAGAAADEVIFGVEGLTSFLKKGDVVIDGGNSFYKDSVRRAKKLARKGIHFLDVGVSGGPGGARHGASLMIGGDEEIYHRLEGLFQDLSVPGGYAHMGASGAGHFVKMIHNGIEYGMMQSLAEGFAVLKESSFDLNLKKVAEVYNHGTVIQSRLLGWLRSAFEHYGEDLMDISGSVGYTGEGEWTVKTARKFRVPTPVIKDSFRFRVQSQVTPSYIGKILSALRSQFGGHEAKQK